MIAGWVTVLVGDAFLPGEPGDAWEGVAETPALILLSLQITEEGEQWGIPCLSFPRQGANSAARPLAGFLPTRGGDMVGREQFFLFIYLLAPLKTFPSAVHTREWQCWLAVASSSILRA